MPFRFLSVLLSADDRFYQTRQSFDGSSRPSLRLAFHYSDYTRSFVHLLGPFITFQPHSAQLP